jgi:hypothetical protein
VSLLGVHEGNWKPFLKFMPVGYNDVQDENLGNRYRINQALGGSLWDEMPSVTENVIL